MLKFIQRYWYLFYYASVWLLLIAIPIGFAISGVLIHQIQSNVDVQSLVNAIYCNTQFNG